MASFYFNICKYEFTELDCCFKKLEWSDCVESQRIVFVLSHCTLRLVRKKNLLLSLPVWYIIFFNVNLKSTHYSLTFLHLSPSAFYFFGFPACISFDSWSLNVIMRIFCEKTVNSGTATDVVATSEGFIVRLKWLTMILASTNKSDSFTDNHFLWNLSWTLANRLTLFTDTTVTVIFIIFDWSVTINVLSRV